jgi:sulfite exporter TauE/SafE
MEFFAGLLLGFIGSLHCVGMCGPLALALPFQSGKGSVFLNQFLYQSGRILSYTLLGFLAGLAGESFFIAGWQQGLSIVSGILIIIMGLGLMHKGFITSGLQSRIQKGFSILLQKKGILTFAGIGILNGLLPCGLVYIALGTATVSGSWNSGILTMMGFGFGTLPAMAGIGIIKTIATPQIRMRLTRTAPILSVFIGVLLIVRGMNLGIPYLSPETQTSGKMECCEVPQGK